MQSSYLLINHIRTHYLHWNAGSAMRPVVLLHGLAEGARLWQKTAPLLAEAGHRVLAPDLRGHGQTDDIEDDYQIETFVIDTAGFLEYAQIEQPLLVGHGLGAAVAMEYAARVSRGPRSPAGLVLVEGGLFTPDRWNAVDTPGSPDGLSVEDFLSRLKYLPGKWHPDEQDLQVLLSYFQIDEDETIIPRLTSDQIGLLHKAQLDFQAYERLKRLNCPLLIIPARPPDPLLPKEEQELAEKELALSKADEIFSSLEVRWLEDCSSEVPLHKPADLARLVLNFARDLLE
jgi:pimeloyl-ACP methyl ester carboxylesterase